MISFWNLTYIVITHQNNYFKEDMEMIVLKDEATKSTERPINVTINTEGRFKDEENGWPYRNLEREKAYRIASEVVYRPLECVKKIRW